MSIVIHGWPTNIHPDFAGIEWSERFFLFCQRIVQNSHNLSSIQNSLFSILTPKTNAYNEQSLLTMLGLSKTIDLENNTLTRGILGKEFKYKNNADDQIPISNAILQHNENIKKLKPEDFLELLYL